MQAFQVQLANRPLHAGGSNARDNADEHGVADRPTCKMQRSAVELSDAIRDLRISCISAFRSRRVIPALGRIRRAFTRCFRFEDAVATNYMGRGWGDETERAINADISNWHCSRF